MSLAEIETERLTMIHCRLAIRVSRAFGEKGKKPKKWPCGMRSRRANDPATNNDRDRFTKC